MIIHYTALACAVAAWGGLAFAYVNINMSDTTTVRTIGRAMFLTFGIVVGLVIPLLPKVIGL